MKSQVVVTLLANENWVGNKKRVQGDRKDVPLRVLAPTPMIP